MICGNQDIKFKASKACASCGLYAEGQSYRLSGLIPEGHCHELLHSLLPYMTTFENGGWFKWERTRDRVVVCCPAVTDNVCVELRKITAKKPHDFEYNVLEVKGRCAFYRPGMSRRIDAKGFRDLCRDLFNVLYAYVKTGHDGISVTCGRGTGESKFTLEKS